MSGCTTRPVGGSLFGIVIVGLPCFASFTVGRPPTGATFSPSAASQLADVEEEQQRVVLLDVVAPADADFASPSFGATAISTRLPVAVPMRLFTNVGWACFGSRTIDTGEVPNDDSISSPVRPFTIT